MASSDNSHYPGGDKHEDVHEDTSIVSHTTTRRVMKHLMDTKTVSIEAVACLSKATEVFMMHFVGSVVKSLETPQSMHEIKYEDVARVVQTDPMCEFLVEMIPPIPATKQGRHSSHYSHHHLSSSSAAASSGSSATNSQQTKRIKTSK